MAPLEDLPKEKESQRRVYSRREKGIALFVGTVLIGYAYATDMASGVLYAKLLEKRSCATVESIKLSLANNVNVTVTSRQYWSPVTTEMETSSVSVRTALPEEKNKNNTSECGGLGEGASATVWVMSIYTAVRCFCSPLGGIVLDTFSSRGAVKLSTGVFMIGTAGSLLATEIFHLYFTTVITGIGGALSSIVGYKVVNSAFPHMKDLVGGIAGLCIGIIVIIIAFVGTYAMEEAGWRGYYYTVNGVVAMAFLSNFFLPADLYTIAEMDMTAKKSKCAQIVARFWFSACEFARGFRRGFGLYRDVGFHLLNFAWIFYAMGAYFPFVFVAKQAKDFGASEAKANRQVVYVGPAFGLGSIIFCGIFNHLRIHPLIAEGVAFMGMGLTVTAMMFVVNYNELLIVVVVLAVFIGAGMSLGSAASEQCIKNKKLASHCHGHAVFWSTIPSLVAPPFAAFLHKVSDTYAVPYAVGGVCLFIGGVLLCVDSRRSQVHNAEEIIDVSMSRKLSVVIPSDVVDNIPYHFHGQRNSLRTFTSSTSMLYL